MANCESIEQYNINVGKDSSADHYFKELLEACYEKNLLDDKTLKKIYYERLEVLKVQLKYYTKDESSSVMVEDAENLMEGIDYTIGVYLKTFDYVELAIRELKNVSLSDMLKMGYEVIREKTSKSKKLFDDIMKNKLKVDNYSYNDTIEYGIPVFFKEYIGYLFTPHEAPGSIDYQLYNDNVNYKGIEYMNNYLETLSLENEFCAYFDISEIKELLRGYDKDCDLLLINIFELVLINSIGLITCGNTLNGLNITSIDREIIKGKLGKLSLEELRNTLFKCSSKCCETLGIENKELISYIRKAILKITPLIDESIKLNRLEKVFISFKCNSDNNYIKYEDGKKLSNSVFRKLCEKIRESSCIDDKIKLIKINIKSLEDLTDMLQSECLFEDEYIKVFKSLYQMEVILLAKYVYYKSLSSEYDKEWYIEFNKYISSLSKDEQNAIEKLKQRIQII